GAAVASEFWLAAMHGRGSSSKYEARDPCPSAVVHRLRRRRSADRAGPEVGEAGRLSERERRRRAQRSERRLSARRSVLEHLALRASRADARRQERGLVAIALLHQGRRDDGGPR